MFFFTKDAEGEYIIDNFFIVFGLAWNPVKINYAALPYENFSRHD
jgi:hypothetical protein